MDNIIVIALVFVLVAAIAPMLLMRGQFGKARGPGHGKARKGGDGGDAAAISPILMGIPGDTGGGKAKGHSTDNDGGGASDGAGSDGGGGDGGGGE